MMQQQQFEKTYQTVWQEYQDLLNDQEKYRQQKTTAEQLRLPLLYKSLCHHLSIAKTRQYSPQLIDYLHHLVLQGHQHLYRDKNTSLWRIVEFIFVRFPQTFRHYIHYFYCSLAVFLIPAVIVGMLCYQNSEFIYHLIPNDQVSEMEAMYDPENRHIGRTEKRASKTNLTMFGYYIYNNIGIGFRTFAGGILFGLGSLFFLFYNGLVLGGVSGHLSQAGFIDTFWSFVLGHGAFELTAIVICGMAGLMLGHQLVAPKQYRRTDALKKISPDAVVIVMGAALMLLIAAFIEAFWSSIQMNFMIKYVVAFFLWLFVILYLSQSGKVREY